MKNSTIGKISTKKSGFPKSKFNYSHDVNTTCSWSDVQPLMCRTMIPDSKAVVGVESLIRLAPMVAPTFGDARFKTWHEFVAMSDLTRNFDALMAQTRVNRGSSSFVPNRVPYTSLFDLSCLALIGASCTLYYNGDGALFDNIHTWENQRDAGWMQQLFSDLATDIGTSTSQIVDNNLFPSSSPFYGADGFFRFNPTTLLPENHAHRNDVWIPVNRGRGSISAPFGSYTWGSAVQAFGGDVTMDSADVLIIREYNGHGYAFAFRLSDFGKRIRKALIGCGYELNFDDANMPISLMPLFALHKAWYELFGLTLFDNYEDTYANKILQRYDNENQAQYQFQVTNLQWLDDFFGFAVELGSLWYTEKTNFVNAHTASLTPNVKDPTLNGSPTMPAFLDVLGASDGYQPASSNIYSPLASIGVDESDAGKNSHYRTITQNHGQLDSELLKRLYKWTNRNSVVGQRVRDLLVQQGLADYVDECEPRFIGYDDTHINISDVTSMADTFENGELVTNLGTYGGQGKQYVDSKTFTYDAKEHGFYIVLCSVVPEAGFAQGIDMNNYSIDKNSFYQPEFDGLGMEINPKIAVCADAPISNPKMTSANSLSAGFGFVPRYTRLKVMNNRMNGDFNLRSVRANYEPYTLDRIFAVNEKRCNFTEVGNVRSGFVSEQFSAADFPIAGNVWRYIGRYPFLANFNRIFANIGETNKRFNSDVSQLDYTFELGVCQSDNFLVHNVVHFDYYAPMLPIEDSFETLDEGNEGKANSSVEKS